MNTYFVYQSHLDGSETLYRSGLDEREAIEEFNSLDRLIESGYCGDGCATIGSLDREDDIFVAQRLGLI